MSVRKGLPENVTIPPITIAEGDKSAEMEVTAAAGAELEDSTVDLLATGRRGVAARRDQLQAVVKPHPGRPRWTSCSCSTLPAAWGLRSRGCGDGFLNLVKEMDDKKFNSRIGLIAYRDHKSERESRAPEVRRLALHARTPSPSATR